MNKEKIMALIAKKTEARAALIAKGDESEDVTEIKSLRSQVDAIDAEIAELNGLLAGFEDAGSDPVQRSVPGPVGTQNILATYGLGGQSSKEERNEEKFSTMEYRKAFMDFVLRGVRSPEIELRIDATTQTTDISAVIPTTVMNKVVEKMEDYGRIYARVGKSNVKGGLEIPVATLKPTASWVSEGSVADKQKKTITGKISFNYYKLQVRVAVTLEADTVSLPVFESTIASNINEAIVVALEQAIISGAGSGSGQPLGIINDASIPAARIVQMSASDLGEYDKWTTVLGKVPRKYRAGAVWILNDADYNKYIVGMVDAEGQPVARTTYGLDGVQTERFLGKEVVAVEDYLEDFDAASVGDIFGIVCRLEDYMVNSNMQLTFRRYFDENTDEWISKATLLCDGKLADPNGVVLLKKK
jgi:HK97 family phage major capsid protein